MTFHRRFIGALQRSIDIIAGQEHRRTFSGLRASDTFIGAIGAKPQNPCSGASAHSSAPSAVALAAGHRRTEGSLKGTPVVADRRGSRSTTSTRNPRAHNRDSKVTYPAEISTAPAEAWDGGLA